mmetsp:Transcript_123302/g.275393  ORF Transcript_123302/g.275393 Transcript_123302/m.275393 type:complete len:259 (+) Transcript_123302:294-1070(+)
MDLGNQWRRKAHLGSRSGKRLSHLPVLLRLSVMRRRGPSKRSRHFVCGGNQSVFELLLLFFPNLGKAGLLGCRNDFLESRARFRLGTAQGRCHRILHQWPRLEGIQVLPSGGMGPWQPTFQAARLCKFLAGHFRFNAPKLCLHTVSNQHHGKPLHSSRHPTNSADLAPLRHPFPWRADPALLRIRACLRQMSHLPTIITYHRLLLCRILIGRSCCRQKAFTRSCCHHLYINSQSHTDRAGRVHVGDQKQYSPLSMHLE